MGLGEAPSHLVEDSSARADELHRTCLAVEKASPIGVNGVAANFALAIKYNQQHLTGFEL